MTANNKNIATSTDPSLFITQWRNREVSKNSQRIVKGTVRIEYLWLQKAVLVCSDWTFDQGFPAMWRNVYPKHLGLKPRTWWPSGPWNSPGQTGLYCWAECPTKYIGTNIKIWTKNANLKTNANWSNIFNLFKSICPQSKSPVSLTVCTIHQLRPV